MDYLNKFKKEPRLIVAALNFIFLFLPWISVNVDDWGLDISSNASGFNLLFNRVNILIGLLVFLIAILLIAIPFVPMLEKFKKPLYIVVPVIAIILAFIITAGQTGDYFGVEVNHGIGFWLSLLANLAIIVLTFVIDFKISNQSFKQKGLKGVFSDVAGQFTNSASEMASGLSHPKTAPANVICPSCNSPVTKGTKFCPKCGTQLPEAKTCPGCGAELPAGTVFCPNCGTKAQ